MKDPYQRQLRRVEQVGCKLEPKDLPRVSAPAKCTALCMQDDSVNRVLAIPEHGLVATACNDSLVRVYESEDSLGKPMHTMAGHSTSVNDLAHVEGNIIVSVGADGNLITWSATSGCSIEAMRLGNNPVRTVAVHTGLIIVSTTTGDLIFYSHQSGSNLKRVKRIHRAHVCEIVEVIAAGELLLTLAYDRTVGVWDGAAHKRRALLTHSHHVMGADANDAHIATCSMNELRLYRNGGDFALQRAVFGLHGHTQLLSVAFVGSDAVMTAGDDGVLAFTDVSEGRPLGRVSTSCDGIWDAVILPGDRVALAERGAVENEIIDLPQNVLHLISPKKYCPPRPRFFAERHVLVASFLGIMAIALARRRH